MQTTIVLDRLILWYIFQKYIDFEIIEDALHLVYCIYKFQVLFFKLVSDCLMSIEGIN